MPDKKNQSETTPNDNPPLPAHPPRQSRKDYSVLPQKPITLKHEIKTPPALKKSTHKRKAGTKPKSTPKPKVAKASGPSPADQWTLRGISQEAREAASAAAEREGLEVGKWIERQILERAEPENTQQFVKLDEALLESLQSIDERLDRLENQKGFWIRFWDRFMEQR
jgi:hypothetical protein